MHEAQAESLFLLLCSLGSSLLLGLWGLVQLAISNSEHFPWTAAVMSFLGVSKLLSENSRGSTTTSKKRRASGSGPPEISFRLARQRSWKAASIRASIPPRGG